MPELCLSYKCSELKNQNRLVGGLSYRYATIRVNDAQTTKSEKLIKFHGKNSLKFKSDGCVRRPKSYCFLLPQFHVNFFWFPILLEKKGDVLMSFQSFYPGHTALKFRLVALHCDNCQIVVFVDRQTFLKIDDFFSYFEKIRCPGFSISIFCLILSQLKPKFWALYSMDLFS